MSDLERALTDWLNYTCNDYYALYSQAFANDVNKSGVRIVEHEAPAIHRAFYILLQNQFPSLKDMPCPYGKTDESFTLWPDGVQVTIRPYDDEIHHTQYVKEI